MNKNTVLKLVLSVAATAAAASAGAQAFAPAATPEIDARQARQEQRIERGVQRGEITRREARALYQTQREITRAEARAKADGHVTRAEVRHLTALLDRADQQIRDLRHDRDARRPG
jgi:hypothetical protein